jgi:hypothetical protein
MRTGQPNPRRAARVRRRRSGRSTALHRAQPFDALGDRRIVVSAEAARAAGLDPDLPQRLLDLKGKQTRTAVVSLRVGP